jgi:hypothetical protein
MDCIKRPTKRKAIAPRRSDAGTQQQIERCGGQKLGRERQWAIGTSQAMEDQASHRCARGDLLVLIRNEASVTHASQVEVFSHTGTKASMI